MYSVRLSSLVIAPDIIACSNTFFTNNKCLLNNVYMSL